LTRRCVDRGSGFVDYLVYLVVRDDERRRQQHPIVTRAHHEIARETEVTAYRADIVAIQKALPRRTIFGKLNPRNETRARNLADDRMIA
jgi:hypothetical protein